MNFNFNHQLYKMAEIDPAIMGDSSSENNAETADDEKLNHDFVAWVFMNSFSGDGWKPKQLATFGTIQ